MKPHPILHFLAWATSMIPIWALIIFAIIKLKGWKA